MNPLTFSETSAAQSRAFTKSPSGLARNNRFASDIQFASAYLKRVGAGADRGHQPELSLRHRPAHARAHPLRHARPLGQHHHRTPLSKR